MKMIWDARARLYDLCEASDFRRGPHKAALFREMAGRVLFVAVGTGVDIRHFPPGGKIVAIDISQEMLRRAGAHRKSYRGALRLVRADALNLCFPDASFDTVVTSCTLCSVPDPLRALREVYRVLRPGGRLLMFEHVRSRNPVLGLALDLMTCFTRPIGTEMNRDTLSNAMIAGFRITRVESVFLDILLSVQGVKAGPTESFPVSPKLYLALLWHQHQPVYKDTAHPTPQGSYRHPWVRLHALRDYYSMAALVSEHPGVHLTINLTPALLWQIEVSTTPFYHPILPLLVDTDRATIDRPGTTHPRRFARPEDAGAQVWQAVECYERCFGRPPRGMWPAEGAVSQFVVPLFARHGVRWIATDRGVLARSGRWGYDADNPDVLCQPYRAEEGGHAISVFFRDTQLSDAIGFRYPGYPDYGQAARDFLREVKERFAWRVARDKDRVLTVILDGENAWGAYREDGRPFLHALYGLLEQDAEVRTVTFAEYLEGNPARGIVPHPLEGQAKVYDLFTGSWIDENGSAPGVDLGTWIGEAEENRGWELLGQARDFLDQAEATPATAPAAFQALYMAEGSDWFWWFGQDQEVDNDEELDDLFRTHLKNVYRGLGAEPPAELDRHIVPHAVVWTFAQPVERVERGDRLTVRTNCPGVLTWRLDDGEPQEAGMVPVGGVMAGVQRHHLTLGPFPPEAQEVRFVFRCSCQGCTCGGDCCLPGEYRVRIV